MMRTLSALAASALILSACGQQQVGSPDAETPAPDTSASAPRAAARDAQVLTAEGYGPLRIGMSRSEVVAALGDDANPEAVGGADPEACDEWRPARAPEGLRVMILDGRLARVTATAPSTVETESGLGVGDAAAAIKTAYGDRLTAQPHKYVAAPAEDLFVWTTGGPVAGAYVEDPAARGVRYEINGEGRVQMIHAGGPAIQLVEGCA